MVYTVPKSLFAKVLVEGLASEDRLLDMAIELGISYEPDSQTDPEYDYSVSYRVLSVGESLGISGFDPTDMPLDMDVYEYCPPSFGGSQGSWSFREYDILDTSANEGSSVWNLYVDLNPEEVTDEHGFFHIVVHVDVTVEEKRPDGSTIVYK